MKDVRIPAPRKGVGLDGSDVCIFCHCSRCGHDCTAVLRGTSRHPPTTPLSMMPKHVQDGVAMKRRLLGMDATEPDGAAGKGDDDDHDA